MELFRLFVTIAVKNTEANSAIDDTADKAEDAEGKMSGSFGKIGTAALKMATVVGSAAVTAAGALTKAAVEGYADYEQLVEGVDTLFKDSSKKVQEYAAKAYSTAGLSANQYMETVTSFSASLLQSLGGNTKEAAEMADMAIIDMSDNANKMGTDMSMIQNAYQGFAKQNYTMLDNLKLGYGGTQEEMKRLLQYAETLKAAQGEHVEYSITSFADVVEAIHVVQDNIGITGTTAQEAGTTIQGSIGAMKGAWSNLLVGIASGNQDINQLYSDLYDSFMTVADNLIPRIKTVFTGLFNLVVDKLPWIDELAIAIGVVASAIAAYNVVQAITAAKQAAEVTTLGALIAAKLSAAAATVAMLAPYIAIAAAIAAVITIGVKLYKNWDTIKEKASALKSYLHSCFAKLKQDTIDQWNGLKNGIVDKITSAKNKVKSIIDTIKGFFKFTADVPKIKMPHFAITPEGWKLGDLLQGVKPSLGIEWYAKAMDNPMVMTSPTIFGYNPRTGNVMGGGEAGSEVVSGTNTLMGMISDAVSKNNVAMIEVLYKILSAILSMDGNMGDNLKKAIDGTGFTVNKREFGRLVREVV